MLILKTSRFGLRSLLIGAGTNAIVQWDPVLSSTKRLCRLLTNEHFHASWSPLFEKRDDPVVSAVKCVGRATHVMIRDQPGNLGPAGTCWSKSISGISCEPSLFEIGIQLCGPATQLLGCDFVLAAPGSLWKCTSTIAMRPLAVQFIS